MKKFLRLEKKSIDIQVVKTFVPADERQVKIGDFVITTMEFNTKNEYGDNMLKLQPNQVLEVLQQLAFGWWVARRESDGKVGFFPRHIVQPLYDKKDTAAGIKKIMKGEELGKWRRMKLCFLGPKGSGKTTLIRCLLGEKEESDVDTNPA